MTTFLKFPKCQKLNKGFTLIELLVVVAIVAILVAVVIVILDPLEHTRQNRDSVRMADLSNLSNAINSALDESGGASVESVLCSNSKYPCSGVSYPVESSTRSPNGTGWIKINLENAKNLKMSELRIDPTNDSTYHYAYCADNDGWEIDTVLESDLQKNKMAGDLGDQNATDLTGRYEVGTNLTLINNSGSPCTY